MVNGLGALLLIINPPVSIAGSGREIAQKTLPSVVLVVAQDDKGQPVALGSGFLIRRDMVASNFHVIDGAASGYVKPVGLGKQIPILGTIGIDKGRDLVLLKIAEPCCSPLPLGNDQLLAPGDEIFAFGNPHGLEGTVSQGIVSGIRLVGSDRLIQITAPISPGSSGGPVVSKTGNVVGVAVGSFSKGQNLNFAIPASYVSELLKSASQDSVTALPGRSERPPSIHSDLGNRGVESIEVTHFKWISESIGGAYSFSVVNRLSVPIANIKVLVIFLDRHQKPIDSQIVTCPRQDLQSKSISPGLAARCYSTTAQDVRELAGYMDHRVLDFQVVR